MMKDEGPYVLEWVAHHMAVGFTDLVVFTNDCTDGTDLMLMRLEELGLARHRVNTIPDGIKPQPSALKHAQVDPEVGDSDWLLVFDADEFLCIRHGDGTLDDLIGAIEAEGGNGMVITWRIFGSGGVRDWSRDFVTEQYLMAAPPMWNKGWGVKTLFRFDPEVWKLGIHRPSMKNKVLDTDFPHGVKWLNGSGRPMEDYFKFRGWRSIVRTVGYDWAQMNHYAVKSADAYAMRKFRGNVNNKKDKYNADYWALQDRNEVRDDTMLRYSARRREIFEGLLTDPELNRLHHAALARAEARLAEVKATPDYAAFLAGLEEASAVPITQVSAKPPKERDPEKIAAKMSDVEKRVETKRAEEKRKPPEAREVQPLDSYVQGPVDMSAEPPMEWAQNHTVRLPADPRVFTPPALLSIIEGKFERNLARNLPKLITEFGTYVELGAGSGFLAAHLAQDRPDLRIHVQQSDPGGRLFIDRLFAANGLEQGERLVLSDAPAAEDPQALGALLATAAPACLVLGDDALSPDTLAQALKTSGRDAPPLLALTGRLWAARAAQLPAFERVLKAAGYVARLPLDPLVVAAYRTAAADMPE
ncbi:glycosyltransferase family 2 protein [Mesobaculum littorinae]|uniref:Glycosyltransferase family 2 protein n=2 Tax=Mesobaculum littorinae TaxID=2486419 RepID=A0A438AKG2_9RHOB|nr:glycosyltransferase family 2 protein [Mesobaculum littorinae]